MPKILEVRYRFILEILKVTAALTFGWLLYWTKNNNLNKDYVNKILVFGLVLTEQGQIMQKLDYPGNRFILEVTPGWFLGLITRLSKRISGLDSNFDLSF